MLFFLKWEVDAPRQCYGNSLKYFLASNLIHTFLVLIRRETSDDIITDCYIRFIFFNKSYNSTVMIIRSVFGRYAIWINQSHSIFLHSNYVYFLNFLVNLYIPQLIPYNIWNYFIYNFFICISYIIFEDIIFKYYIWYTYKKININIHGRHWALFNIIRFIHSFKH